MWITYEEVAFTRMGSVHEEVWDSNVNSAIWITYEEVAFRRIMNTSIQPSKS